MIIIENEQNIVSVDVDLEKSIRESILYTLENQGFNHEVEVNVLLVDNEAIRSINQETRNIDSETDVLSFPMIEYEEGKTYKDLYLKHKFGPEFYDGEDLVIGDVVISVEKAKEQSIDFGHSLKREVCYLTVHSVLHLLGYDHMDEDDKSKMRAAEEEILGALEITRE
jgi:probable rRNA maturation factor